MPGACKYVGPLTGVKVWGIDLIRMLQRRRRITGKDSLKDAAVEIDAEEIDGEEEDSSV